MAIKLCALIFAWLRSSPDSAKYGFGWSHCWRPAGLKPFENNAINHPFVNGLHNLFMVIWGMVSYCLTTLDVFSCSIVVNNKRNFDFITLHTQKTMQMHPKKRSSCIYRCVVSSRTSIKPLGFNFWSGTCASTKSFWNRNGSRTEAWTPCRRWVAKLGEFGVV